MAFTIRGLNGLNDLVAAQKVQSSFQYLKRSALARQIINDLEAYADVCIDVNDNGEPFYANPESSYNTITTGGTVVWNSTMTLETTDSDRLRPAAAWVPQHFERRKVKVQKTGLSMKLARTFNLSEDKSVWQNVRARKFGTLSTHMILMHELGHALQYATYPQEFRDIKGDPSLSKTHVENALEETNLACVEIPVALELNELGANETPRWTYQHSGHF